MPACAPTTTARLTPAPMSHRGGDRSRYFQHPPIDMNKTVERHRRRLVWAPPPALPRAALAALLLLFLPPPDLARAATFLAAPRKITMLHSPLPITNSLLSPGSSVIGGLRQRPEGGSPTATHETPPISRSSHFRSSSSSLLIFLAVGSVSHQIDSYVKPSTSSFSERSAADSA